MNKMKVLIADKLSEEGMELIKREFEVEVKTGLSEDELVNIIKDYDALIVRSATKVTRRIIENSRLKVIGRAGVGVDNIDVEAATERGILVVNAPCSNTIAACELTLGLMFSLVRNIPQANQSIKEGKWEKNKFLGTELYRKTLGVIGLGRIGREVAIRAKGLGMNVIGYDPYISKTTAAQYKIRMTNFEELLKTSDIITIHTPLTRDTYHLIGYKEFEMMKKGVYIINCARGGIIDEKALYDNLISQKVAGCALDVFEKEPPENNPLLQLPNVIATPHIGASTKEAQKMVSIEIAEEVINALKGEPVRSCVNALTNTFQKEYTI
ncbi:MAG: phosphoglycerate dehydrogenase [Thermovenabulum sp.]|uniref:phosphoglycerate dehydrogenase n=1 Tax=Thermovenabulum sp. TaxID=3100335 RepID=UPI003C7CB711